MNNKFPVYLATIETSIDGTKRFVKASSIYQKSIWGMPYSRFFFKLRRMYFDKPNCNFNCPPGKTFFCCKKFGCKSHCGFFEWEETFFFSKEEREKILSLWNNGTGWLRKDGCVLPRELRSYICLVYECRDSKTKG